MDPRAILALALKEMGANAERIGSLNITDRDAGLAPQRAGPPTTGDWGAALMAIVDKVVIVTKKTALEELVEQFNTREQARFYLEHSGVSFAEYEASHAAYQNALARVRDALPPGTRAQWVERAFVPTFLFGEDDLVLTVGPDGLVVNTAKYLDGQALFAVNPDPDRIDGVLLPFRAGEAGGPLRSALRGELRPEAHHDGPRHPQRRPDAGRRQRPVPRPAHPPVRPLPPVPGGDRAEDQSSSGIIVSTGAGSTGWLRSVLTGAAGIVGSRSPPAARPQAPK